ncbi:DUF1800 family protein [Ferruginibacter yonginensis]|uniref:DUF1800 family protein n=1 Tax=Ferruginibacter yonginensis TaxID=1310416 RepID=A0ABV8QSQ8_9BACT
MPVSTRLKNQHLLWRAGFGPMAEILTELDTMPQKKLWKTLLNTSNDAPTPINIAINPLEDKAYMNPDGTMMTPGMLTAEQRKQLNKQWRQELKDMNLAWLSLMINSKAQLREKMSLFWHGHFACRVNNSFFSQQLLNIIRANALGNFGELLKLVSKTPAMLQFLNNQQNKKGKPNENFAREVMELFTMGRGNYTEKDVKEGARAFTGWSFDKNGQYSFKENVHDNDTKTFLGETGNFNGDDILNILLKKPQTAYYITQKIYKYFVNEQVDEAKIQTLSTRFYNNNYDIKKLLEDIFTSDWFYDEKNIGVKIKSPVELLVGIRRYLPLALDNDDAQILYQKVLGQELFYPPNVAGWPGGKNWIDSSTLMVRLQIPQVFSSKDAIDIRPKTDDDINMGLSQEKRLKLGKNAAFTATGGSATINWQMVNSNFEKTARPQLSQTIINTLLQTTGRIDAEVLSKYLNNESRDAFIKSVVINTMSTPEYQLC